MVNLFSYENLLNIEKVKSEHLIKKNLLLNDQNWIFLAKDKIIFGVTDEFQEQLGDIVFIDFPNAKIKKGSPVCLIESVKSISEVYLPMDCSVLEINHSVLDKPSLVNEFPYHQGWLCHLSFDKKHTNEYSQNFLLSTGYKFDRKI